VIILDPSQTDQSQPGMGTPASQPMGGGDPVVPSVAPSVGDVNQPAPVQPPMSQPEPVVGGDTGSSVPSVEPVSTPPAAEGEEPSGGTGGDVGGMGGGSTTPPAAPTV